MTGLLLTLLPFGILAKSPFELKTCPSASSSDVLCKTGISEYRNNAPPHPYPAIISPRLDIIDFVEINPELKTFTMFIRIGFQWNDSSISFKQSKPRWFELTKFQEDYWKPRIDVKDVQDVKKLETFGGGTNGALWLINPNVFDFSEAMKVSVSCSFDFTSFPFDEHHCHLEYGDSSYDVADLVFDSITISHNEMITGAVDEPIILDNSKFPFTIQISPMAPHVLFLAALNETYSYVGITVQLKRNSLGLLIGRFYGPTGAFAYLSMISYFIDHKQVPGRMGMLVTLYLISVNVYASLDAPKNRGFSYIDLWMVCTQIPILIGLLEYGFVLWSLKYNITKVLARWTSEAVPLESVNRLLMAQEDRLCLIEKGIKRIDFIFFVLNFVYYTTFNIFYWSF